MQFGVCGDFNVAAAAARASYDFVESSVGGLLKPRETEEAFRRGLDAASVPGLPYPVLNCFIPADLKITGPEVDSQTLQSYVITTMRRAEHAGVRVIVFGSGGARQVPDNFDTRTARRQIVSFCSMVAPIAHDHGVTVVVEPLSHPDCNILNTVSECVSIVRELSLPAIRLLVDSYHMMRENDSYEDIVTHGDLLSHVHIATASNRLAPGAEPCDFTQFFGALEKARYRGRISIEAKISDPDADLPTARRLLCSAFHF